METLTFNHRPTKKQFLALEYLYDHSTKFLVFGGGAGGGKSWIGCEWILALALNFPGTSYFIGRKVLKELKRTTLRTFWKVCAHHEIPNELITYNNQDSTFLLYNGSIIDLLQLKQEPSDPNYQSLGSLEYTAGWIEEGGEVPFKAFDVLKSRIGRNKNDKHNLFGKLLITCNPSKNWLYRDFYKPYKDKELAEDSQFIQSLIDDNPKNESGYKANLVSLKDKALKERLLYGNWEYDDDPAALIDYDSITNLFSNIHVNGSQKYITMDVARYGRDNTVIMVWAGFKVIDIKIIQQSSIESSVKELQHLRKVHNVPASKVVVDEDGVGGGVVDMVHCKGFVNNATAIKQYGKKVNYANRKSQCYFNLAERVCDSGIWVDTQDEDIKEKLTQELEAVIDATYGKDKPKKVLDKDAVKERIGRSPDLSDALMMREYFELLPQGMKAMS